MDVHGIGPGSVLGGRYALSLRRSEGPSHERWTARDQTLERDVAVIVFASDSPLAAPALDAARRASGLEDPRLVRVLDVGTSDGFSFIVEEPLTGGIAMTQLLLLGGLPAEETRRLVGEAATGLERARQRGLHHMVLDPDSIVRMPDGSVKVRGLATEAVLSDAERAWDEAASRIDAVGLVRLAYAGLTGRWPSLPDDSTSTSPLGSGSYSTSGSSSSTALLPPAPTVVGGVMSPSEIAVGVPQDLDAICRLTLNLDEGPVSPGDLAIQVAPWSEEMIASTLAAPMADLAVPAVDPDTLETEAVPVEAADPPRSTETRRIPTVGAAAPFDQYADRQGRAASDPEYPMSADPTRAIDPVDPYTEEARGASGALAGSAGAALASAGSSVAGAASSAKAKMGSFARAAADRASARAAERRNISGDDFDGDDVALTDTLEETDQNLEPPVPIMRDAMSRPSGASSGIALAIVGALVLVALFLGVNKVLQIGQSDGQQAKRPVVTQTVVRPNPTGSTPAPQATTSAPAPTTNAVPVSIVGGTGFDPEDDNTESDSRAKLAFDGNPGTVWESRWYGSATYNRSKSGVGLVLDLSAPTKVTSVDLTLPEGKNQNVTVYAADSASLNGAQEIGSVSGESGTINLKAPADLNPASKIIVWVTKPAPAEAPKRFRAQIAEVVVK